jgi:uncharacterized heparinase superfamily protein
MSDIDDTFKPASGRRWRRRNRARQLVWVPHNFCPGNAEAGRRLDQDGLIFGNGAEGLTVATLEQDPHSFAWLRDLRSAELPGAQDQARRLIGQWLAAYNSYDPRIWAPPLMSERIVNWITHFQWYGGDDDFRAAVFDSLQGQVTRLRKNARLYKRGVARVRAAKGLIYAAACVPGYGRRLRPALDMVERELTQHLFDDGGIYERSPALQFHLLRDLVEIRTVLAGSMSSLPPVIDETISRLTPLVWLARHANGRLAQFNGGGANDAGMVAAILKAAPEVRDVPDHAPQWGFQRMSAANGPDASVVVDAGPPPPAGFDTAAHAGALSFEYCADGALLVVNCGVSAGLDRVWREACRATAAHSTLVVADTNSCEIQPGRGIGRRPRHVGAEKVKAQGVGWVDFSHDGYAEKFRLVHRRRLSLAPDGRGLFGEDRLEPVGRHSRSVAERPFAIRFHLHPGVTLGDLSAGSNGSSVALTLPGGARWTFSAEGADGIELDESVYLGEGRPQASRQIVLSGETSPDGAAHVMWSFTGEAIDGS